MGTIDVKGLSKSYRQYPSRWSRLFEWIVPFAGVRHTDKSILRNINFNLQQGEALGIIGVNGAGKSTLLKLITGTIQPTSGVVHVTGRVAALLELGIGFHPDFTGRQNVYMAAQLLGFSGAEIERLMPDIEAFAEIGDYIDEPVRVYSSGMQMRLAFSVATAHRPDVLIIDEALSVGDAYFQHKSFDRIRVFRELGTTLLIVSHDKAAIQAVCDRAILLNNGEIALEGAPEAVMDYYNALLSAREAVRIDQAKDSSGRIQTRSGTAAVKTESVQLLDENDTALEQVKVGQQVTLRVITKVHTDVDQLVMGYVIKDRLGQTIYGTNSFYLKQTLQHLKAGELVTFNASFAANLGEGSYSISIALHESDTHIGQNYDWVDHALVFQVINIGHEHFIGSSWMPPVLEINR
ncbi:ABC transporter ATP-binding protein [Zwartia sp.]|uniref:ABC transporter ATP-binding protein n=1 Tax=Zwartia sp. TaxID=2978004 RepID=UPI002723FFE4|nr:ABC transporter ATP-binding protein [Zwartia sp.]MDO9023590.1 ABC transporter ATP-binding protein [Zwartia sp.]